MDFDCNGGAFYDYLIKEGYNKRYKIVWMLRNKKPKNLPPNVTGFNLYTPSLRKTYYMYTAKYMTSDHYILGRKRDGQIACYLDHGTIGLKSFKGKIFLPDELDCILVPSKIFGTDSGRSIQSDVSEQKAACARISDARHFLQRRTG